MSKTDNYIIDLHNLQEEIKEIKKDNKDKEELLIEINKLLWFCNYNYKNEEPVKITIYNIMEMIENHLKRK